MKKGIIREMDSLGRVCVPMEYRRVLEIKGGDPIEMHMEGSSIVISKNEESCIFCGNSEGLIRFEGKTICNLCRRDLAEVTE